ncbi:MAG: DUF3467 domain-containing protein [Acidobacteriota bacterium]|nr:DUF3467 domain-containing protein [Acidobacteriota bacterium]
MAEDTPEEKAAESKEYKPLSKVLPVRYYGTEDVVGIFADLAAVQHTAQHFTMFFFQTAIPMSQKESAVLELDELPAKCIARIALTPKLAFDLYKALETNLEKYNKLVEYMQAHGEPPEVDSPETESQENKQ